MSACAHNYVLINVSICFAENFAETFRRNFRRKFRRNLGENFGEISAKIFGFSRIVRLIFGEISPKLFSRKHYYLVINNI